MTICCDQISGQSSDFDTGRRNKPGRFGIESMETLQHSASRRSEMLGKSDADMARSCHIPHRHCSAAHLLCFPSPSIRQASRKQQLQNPSRFLLRLPDAQHDNLDSNLRSNRRPFRRKTQRKTESNYSAPESRFRNIPNHFLYAGRCCGRKPSKINASAGADTKRRRVFHVCFVVDSSASDCWFS